MANYSNGAPSEYQKSKRQKWFYHFYMHRNITPFLSRQGAGRYKLNKETLRKLPILLPPLKEQKIVADLLSAWDTAIERIKGLIAAKEKNFAGIQHSLIYKECLDRKWPEVKLGSVFKERVETQFNILPLLSITREEGVGPRDALNRKDTSNSDKSRHLLLKKQLEIIHRQKRGLMQKLLTGQWRMKIKEK